MEHFGRWQVPRMMRNAINKYGITEVVTMEEKMLPIIGFQQALAS